MLGVVVALVVALVAWFEVEANPSGGPGTAVVVQVRPGESSTSVLDQLGREGVIGSPLAFRMGDLVEGTPNIRPGAYLFHRNQSFSTVRAILAGGSNIASLTVPPGYTLHEVATELDALPGDLGRQFLAVAGSGKVRSPWEPSGSNNLEGLLGTGTYQILPGTTDAQLLTTMAERFDDQAAAAGATPGAAGALGLSPYQLIVVASIVEKEGYRPQSNLGPVARVIYNRLAAGMHLDMDSTVLYALGQDGGPVTAADLKIDSPYNTYLSSGLTPTPVCSPSPAAIRAAVDPPAGSWLYFVVVDKDGTEAFSSTFAQQQANEALAAGRGLG
ncbi:MAG TPA: endolytic transglycosylase MltG [Acidimicrobiales bacterium]